MKNKIVEISCSSLPDKFGIVLTDIIKIPYMNDGCGTVSFNTPEKDLNVDNWPMYEAYVVLMLPSGKHEIITEQYLKPLDEYKEDSDKQFLCASLFDHATSGLRYHLTLLEIQKAFKGN